LAGQVPSGKEAICDLQLWPGIADLCSDTRRGRRHQRGGCFGRRQQVIFGSQLLLIGCAAKSSSAVFKSCQRSYRVSFWREAFEIMS